MWLCLKGYDGDNRKPKIDGGTRATTDDRTPSLGTYPYTTRSWFAFRAYRGTSLISTFPPPRTLQQPMSRPMWWSKREGQALISEVLRQDFGHSVEGVLDV